MHHYVGQGITMVGMLLTEKSAETKHSQAMEFITLEDITALYDATLFPEVYRHCCHLSLPNRPLICKRLHTSTSVGLLTQLTNQHSIDTVSTQENNI
jgi:error-prone DNA polymerase